jgi:hypothetical protein
MLHKRVAIAASFVVAVSTGCKATPSGTGGDHVAPLSDGGATEEPEHPRRAPTPEGSSPVTGLAPTPYTAEQIRAATTRGRRYAWRVEEPGKPAEQKLIVFTVVGEDGAVFVSGSDDDSLKLSSPARATWEELRKHAEFPAAETSIQAERVKTPAGEFDCKLYTVKKADGTVLRFYFANELPGAPVLFYTEKNGERLSTSTLVVYEPGE